MVEERERERKRALLNAVEKGFFAGQGKACASLSPVSFVPRHSLFSWPFEVVSVIEVE